jgi:hypothetical protein
MCVRRPAEITILNKASLKGEDCLKTSARASLEGKPGYLQTFRFRDGATIRIHEPECSERFWPCRIKFTLGQGEWSEGVFELPSALIHQCGEYSCNWYTYRDGYGKLVVAIGMSY